MPPLIALLFAHPVIASLFGMGTGAGPAGCQEFFGLRHIFRESVMDVADAVKKSEPRFPKMVGTRFTLSEYENIRAMASAAGISVCAYVRLRTVGGHIKSRIDKQAIDAAINELRQAKGLMKHLHNNGQKIPFTLVQQCNQAIDRFLSIDSMAKDE